MATYILSQVCVFIAFAIDATSYFFKTKKNFLLLCICYSCFYILSYIFLNVYLAVIANSIFLVRNIWYTHLNNKNKKFNAYLLPIFILNAGFITAFIFLYTSYLDLFLLFSVLLLTIVFAFRNMLIIRIAAVFNGIVWAIYNFIIKGYVNFACNIFMIIIISSTIFLHHIYPKIKQKKIEQTQSSK